MVTNPVLAGIGGIVVLFGLARPAAAQGCGANYAAAPPAYYGGGASASFYPPLPSAYYQRSVGGLVYSYDQAGNPLYYDDYVHYSYPRRFLYRNGGWVLLSRGHSYYGRYHGANYGHAGASYGVHRRSGYQAYSGAHDGTYSPRHHGGYSTRHSGGYRAGHYGGSGGGHAGGRGGGHHGGGGHR